MTADVVIIGGGITGVTSAYLLSKAGKKVVLIEKDRIGSGATSCTTAFITYAIDTSLHQLISMFGEEKARLVWESGNEALENIEEVIHEEGIACDFERVPLYSFATTTEEVKDMEKEFHAALQLGFPLGISHESPLLPFRNLGHTYLSEQAKFHPIKYVESLADKAKKYGAAIFEDTEAIDLSGNDPVIVKTNSCTISASTLLIATYDPFNHPHELFAKKGMYVSYVLYIAIPKGSLPYALYVDRKNPYHYFRVDKGKKNDFLILGGEDHRKEVPIDEARNFKALEKYFIGLFPKMEYEIALKWRGPILEPLDGLPYIGQFSKDNDRHFVAMGFSGNGMTYSMISALMFKDFVLGKKNAWNELYDPRRIATFKQLYEKGVDYMGEFFGGAVKNLVHSKKT